MLLVFGSFGAYVKYFMDVQHIVFQAITCMLFSAQMLSFFWLLSSNPGIATEKRIEFLEPLEAQYAK
jgi:hypothetical protein